MSKTLNPRQEKFAIVFALTGHGTNSAIAAGYSPKNAHRTASDLQKNPEVRARIKQELERYRDEQHEMVMRKLGVAVDTLFKMATGEIRGSMAQLGAANSLLDRGGIPVVKHDEHTGPEGGPIQVGAILLPVRARSAEEWQPGAELSLPDEPKK